MSETVDVVLGLYTGIESEVAGTDYLRQRGRISGGGPRRSESTVTFGPAAADWGPVSHVAIHDLDGTMLHRAALTQTQNVRTGEYLRLHVAWSD